MVVGHRWHATDVEKHLLCVMYLRHHQAGCGGRRTQGDAQRTVRDSCETFLEHLPPLWKSPCLFSSIFGTTILGIEVHRVCITGRDSCGSCRERGKNQLRAMPSVPCHPAGCSQRFSERKIQICSEFIKMKADGIQMFSDI